MPAAPARLTPWGWTKRVALTMLAITILSVAVSFSMFTRERGVPWYEARRDPSGLAPDPASTREAVIQVYAARAVSWRGSVAVHTWISVKPSNAPRFSRYEVIGFGVAAGAPAVRIDRTGPDNYWFGARPEIVLDRRGAGVDRLIDQVKDAVRRYPYPHEYRVWPGPNSNTFTAFVARSVPELGLDLPSNAIGKDYLPGGKLFGAAPSGTGWQVSLFGLAGILIARAEGFELNFLGLNIGFDVAQPALKLPGIGRIGVARLAAPG